MKVSDYKIDAFLKANPDAETIPINEIKEDEPEITIADIMKKLTELGEKINTPKTVDEPPAKKSINDKTDTLEFLAAEIKAIKEEAQAQAIAKSELPEEQTVDDILKGFLGGN